MIEASEVRTLRGWRRELAGEEVLALLAGDVRVEVARGDARPPHRGGGIGLKHAARYSTWL